jgi:ubiquinone/menaquinone biosynthesis C-methylase UbiE
MNMVPKQATEKYLLGHAPKEVQRLLNQGQALNPFTRQVLVEAGITAGMKVLDLGCGPGDVSLIAAELVGETGSVLGVDARASVLEVAQARAQAAGFKHVSFVAKNIGDLELDQEYDAIVGRLILQYLPERVRILRKLTQHLRPGGVVAFQEYDLAPENKLFYPSFPLAERTWALLVEAFQCGGAEPRIGMKVTGAFLEAGLPVPYLRCDTAIGFGPEWVGYDVFADVMRAVLPLLVKQGVVTAEEVDIDTLADRLREENVRQQGVGRFPALISAWVRKE